MGREGESVGRESWDGGQLCSVRGSYVQSGAAVLSQGQLCSARGSYTQSRTAILSHGQLNSGSLMLMRTFTEEAGQQALVHSAFKVTSKIADFLMSP